MEKLGSQALAGLTQPGPIDHKPSSDVEVIPRKPQTEGFSN